MSSYHCSSPASYSEPQHLPCQPVLWTMNQDTKTPCEALYLLHRAKEQARAHRRCISKAHFVTHWSTSRWDSLGFMPPAYNLESLTSCPGYAQDFLSHFRQVPEYSPASSHLKLCTCVPCLFRMLKNKAAKQKYVLCEMFNHSRFRLAGTIGVHPCYVIP